MIPASVAYIKLFAVIILFVRLYVGVGDYECLEDVMIIKCACCESVSDVEEAIEIGEWIPCFFDENENDTQYGPTCPDCVKRLGISLDETGEFVRPLEV